MDLLESLNDVSHASGPSVSSAARRDEPVETDILLPLDTTESSYVSGEHMAYYRQITACEATFADLSPSPYEAPGKDLDYYKSQFRLA